MSREKILFHFLYKISLPKRGELKDYIAFIIYSEGSTIEHINYVFCSDEYLLPLNQEYLNHNTYTDIITFQLSKGKAPVVADIYISAERVRDNAKHLGVSFSRELLRVIFHGALHLCGYGDKTRQEKKQMRSKEDYYLDHY